MESRSELACRLRQRLNVEANGALSALVRLAAGQGMPLYVVGGTVRDLILNRPSPDFDLVVEGDVSALAPALAAAVGARCVLHRQFGTARVQGEGFAFDLATARSESYPWPGSLPQVRPATLQDDLARRDFTINAMALPLVAGAQTELVDPYAGAADIGRRHIRVLHDSSFADDATRILRAIRYSARLHFDIEPRTLSLLNRDVGFLASVNASRLRREFQHILIEEAPEIALGRCQELDVLASIHPDLRFDGALALAFRRARRYLSSPADVYLALLGLKLSPPQAIDLGARLASSNGQRQTLADVPKAMAAAAALELGLRPSQIVRALEPYREPALWAVALAAPQARTRALVRRYLWAWRLIRPSLDGHDLQRLDVPPGPEMGEMVRQLWAARLDGRVRSRAGEERWVRASLAMRSGAGEPPGRR